MKTFDKKNLRYIISVSLGFVLNLLTLIFVFLPAVFEEGQPDSSIFNLMLGNEKLPGSPILIIGFVSLIIGVIITLTTLTLLLLNKSNSKLLTILSVSSIATILIGSAILTCAIFISGFTELNSALGFNQGQWGIKAGTFLVPIFGLLSVFTLFPSAVVILREKDEADKEKAEANSIE